MLCGASSLKPAPSNSGPVTRPDSLIRKCPNSAPTATGAASRSGSLERYRSTPSGQSRFVGTHKRDAMRRSYPVTTRKRALAASPPLREDTTQQINVRPSCRVRASP